MHSYFSALSNRALAYSTAVSFLEHSSSIASVAVSSAICCVVSLLAPATASHGHFRNLFTHIRPGDLPCCGLAGACQSITCSYGNILIST